MVGALEIVWRNSEMRLIGFACLRLVIRCRCRVGGVVGLLGPVASR